MNVTVSARDKNRYLTNILCYQSQCYQNQGESYKRKSCISRKERTSTIFKKTIQLSQKVCPYLCYSLLAHHYLQLFVYRLVQIFTELKTTLLYSGHIYTCLGLNKQIHYLLGYLLHYLLC